ncbi:glycosyltransferase family 2 protein [Erythrobacter fulvus]|nr:glycosyltransferase family 2 protein [Erythrobacter fulvus]
MLKEQKTRPAAIDDDPSIIALVKETPGGDLKATLGSLVSQGIPAFVIGPDARDDLIRLANEIDWAMKPWLLPITSGDVLSEGAAHGYRRGIRGFAGNVVYADDDLIDARGHRMSPHFKPDWNCELFRYFDFVTGTCVVRADCAALMAAVDAADWDGELVRLMLGDGDVKHIRRIHSHRKTRRRPRLPLPQCALPAEQPRVSVIIPTRNRVDLLAACLRGVADTDYPDMEVIVVDNESDDPESIRFLEDVQKTGIRVIRHAGEFNYSRINNSAVDRATGELLCLLNNDIEMIDRDWLSCMVVQALRDDVGAVGAQLLYPDGRIQHAGVALGVGGGAAHAHRFLRPEDEGYFWRHALPQFVSAVTAACLVVKRDRFLAVGGLDEVKFPVAFNDVDLCLKLNERGWQSLYEPRARLIHHESVSRGLDRDKVGAERLSRELAALKQRWRTDTVVDPYHHPHLSRASEQFVIAI